VELICDTMRSATMNYDDPHQVEDVLDKRMEANHHHALHTSHALQVVADGLPALGIVAAVLGVIKTMASIDQPPEVLGKLIGGALVGTFLGVFLSYGFVAPMANKLRVLRGGRCALLPADPRGAGRQPAQPRDEHLHRGRSPEHAAPCAPQLFRARGGAAQHQEGGRLIRLLLLAALGAIPVQAGADTVVVRAGEHAGFTRLVLEFRQRPEWSLTTMEGAAVVALAEGEWRLDASRAFDRIPRSRVDSLTRTPRGVEIALACDCRVTAFEAGATAVVVDVADRSDEDALTGVQSTSSDGAPEQGPGNPEPPAVLSSSPATMTPWRTGNAPAAAPAASPDAARPVREGMVGTLTPPMPEQGPPPAGEPPHAAGELLNQLAEGIARATTQGALRLADPPGPTGTPTVPGPVAPAAANLRLRLPGEEAWLPSEPGPESPCPRNADLDVASWGPGDRTPAEAIMALRHSLAEDIDSVEEERALNLARLYVSLGFGAEARAVTEAMAQRHPQAQLLLAMALIVDGEPGPPVLPDALAECAGRAQMWTALATGQATDAADVTAAVSELPLVLRRSVGPRLIEIFLAAGDAGTAETIRAAIDRAAGPHGAPFDLAAAQIDMGREARRKAEDNPRPGGRDLSVVGRRPGGAARGRARATRGGRPRLCSHLAATRADDLRGTPAGRGCRPA
jgi:hypothetical protein